MRRTHTMKVMLLLVTASIASCTDGRAQKPELLPKPRIGVHTPSAGLSSGTEGLRKFGVRPEASISGNVIFKPDPPRFSMNDQGAAAEAAEIDPGILIVPDPSIDARILWLKPPAPLDPEMIVPQERGDPQGNEP
ncbi:hypothetical protein [Rhodocaloribacter sp.]